ncbi:MAG: hypothetical protein EOP48_03845 [Sphingobacteriales bacterium]|nr:MAG: hypothetical protein EOP48_03845 [Sphingobacteriales bacterium]
MLKILVVSSIAVVAPGQGPKQCQEICANTTVFGGRCVKTLICPSPAVLPEWKTSILHSGEAFVNSFEGLSLPIEWMAQTAGPIPHKYLPIFQTFESCLSDAFNLDQAQDCLRSLKIKSADMF